MYIPRINQMDDFDEILAFMQANSFAAVVSVQEDGIPVATHLPLTIAYDGESITVNGHFAKANPQWQTFTEGETLVIFTGPHAYISPTHYDKGESVPTWNYMAVHAYGNAELIHYDDDPEALSELLETLMHTLEASFLDTYHGHSEQYKVGLMRGVVGFQMQVARLDAKAKLSQNKKSHEQAAIIDTMLASDDSAAREIGKAMQKRLKS